MQLDVPIRVGTRGHTSMAVFPLVLGPGNIPAVTDPDEATEDLALAVLSALAHVKDPGLPVILDALTTAVQNTGGETAQAWWEFLEVGLGDTPARELWRQLMKTYNLRFPGRGTLLEETLNEGRVEGRVEDILRVLVLHGVGIPDDARERITSCTDLEVLGVWFDRSLKVTNTEELFEEHERP